MIKRETLKALEFNKLLDIISDFSNSGISRDAVLNISPLYSLGDIEKRFGQLMDIRRMSQEGLPLKLTSFEDITRPIEKLKPEGAVLDAIELAPFAPVLQIIHDIYLQTKENTGLLFLKELVSHLTGFPEILARLERSVDSVGNILDSASVELAHLRAKIRSLEGRVQKRLEEITGDKRITPFLQDDFVTKRAGRWVLPVRMDSKGMVSGVAHDVSHSGETAFIEPLEIIGLSNELENLIADQKAEEIRILRSICAAIRRQADDILSQFKTLVYLDMLNSIARFAELLSMEIPQMNEALEVRLTGARHPLLMLLQKERNREPVTPLSLSLGGNSTVMVITGPNAGGKTITIKTVGLLLLMALSGIPVPADASSTFPVIDKLLVDIGDEQSIENSLSTFSAHISNISGILREADCRTLALMDELGTGTEPTQGAAIGCAVLNELKDKGALVLATTHLTEVVGFVHMTEGMVNASMEFDQKTFSPLYRLIIGEPGQSHALEAAQKYGLPEKTLELAKKLMGTAHGDFHKLMSDLKETRIIYEDGLAEMNRQKAGLKEKENMLEERIAEAEQKGQEVLKKAYEEAQDIIRETKRQMNTLMEEIKREKNRGAIKKLEKAYAQSDEKVKEFRKEASLSLSDIKEGDEIFVRSLGYDALIVGIEARQNRLRVKAGSMYIEVPLTDISHKQGKKPYVKPSGLQLDSSDEEVQTTLNIIGQRVDEALSRLEPFLNHASMSGLSEVTLIHGIGTGALLRAVREQLKGHALVKQFRQGKQHEGGNGVTIVTLNG